MFFNVLFNDTLNTFLINGYIGIGNILIGKLPSGYLTGIDLRSTACQTGGETQKLVNWQIKTDETAKIIFLQILFACSFFSEHTRAIAPAHMKL